MPVLQAMGLRPALAFLVICALVLGARSAGASTPVRIIVPKDGNLQYLSFWVAHGAGLFEEEGLDVTLRFPDLSKAAPELLKARDAEVAVLPPPQYLPLIAHGEPIVLVANLLQNDPINLVVRRSLFEERKMSASAPLEERLRSLHGLRVGVAFGPPTRLRALFAAHGMDADRDIQMVNFHGKEQNQAFADGQVDALYAHTPYVEQALIDQEARLLVNQSGGDVVELADRQIHALIVTRHFAESQRSTVAALTRAVYRAQQLIHDDRGRAVDAVMHLYPNRVRAHVETIVSIYEPAVPRIPQVSVAGFATALRLFPASKPTPDVSRIDLAKHIDTSFVDEIMHASVANPPARGWTSRRNLRIAVPVLLVAAAIGAAAWRRRARFSS